MQMTREGWRIILREKRPGYRKCSGSLKKRRLRNVSVKSRSELNMRRLMTRFMLRRRMSYMKMASYVNMK